jgi:hypothetical protein
LGVKKILASGLSKLHVLPPNQTVTSKYYQENIPCPFLLYEINRADDIGLQYLQKENFTKLVDFDIENTV